MKKKHILQVVLQIERPRREHLTTPPPRIRANYLAQAQPSQVQTSQEQVSPSQFGQAQVPHPHLAEAVCDGTPQLIAEVAAESQAQTSHSQAAQLQPSPVQPVQSQLLRLAVFAISWQQDFESFGVATVAAFKQPQTPHAHSSHEQTPLQSGHLQSVQPQADFAVCGDTFDPVAARA